MSAPPTLVLKDDDERTTVDRSWPGARPSAMLDEAARHEQARRWWSRLRTWWKPLLAGACTVALCLILLGIGNQQRRVDRLLRRIEALQNDHHEAAPSRTATGQGLIGDRPAELPGVRARVADGGAVEREELELEAATLLIGNDYRGALELYRSLAMRFPEEPVFSDLVSILHRRLGCEPQGHAPGSRCD